MQIDESAAHNAGQSGRLLLTERFEKIQGARPGPPPGENAEDQVGKRAKKTLRLIAKPKQNANSRRYNQ